MQSPILIYDPDGSLPVPPWPPIPSDLTYPECGTIQLINGQSWIDVTFANGKPDANWIFEELQIVNTTDPTPLNIWPGIVTEKTITGFRIQLNGLPNTDNYFLNWAVGGCATADWVVNSGVEATNFLQLTDTPNDYTGQTGKGVKVNATEDGLEFGVVSGGGGDVINVLDYGAVADCVTLFDITMPNGNVVTSAGHTFVAADIGKWTIIRGATAAGVSPLVGKITAVSGHTATLDVTNTSSLTAIAGDSFPRMDFGTDNTIPFVNACLAVPGPGNRNSVSGTPFASTGVMNPILPGDGGTIYIPRGNYLMINGFPGFPASTFWFVETNNLTLKGDGMGQTVILLTSDTRCTMPVFGGFAGSHGRFQNWMMSDLTFFDLNYFSGGGNTLNVQQVDNLHIERIETLNGKGNACINVQGYSTGSSPITRHIYIRDCWIHGNTFDGYSAAVPYGIQGDGMNIGQVLDVHIEGNTIEGPGRHGYEGGGNCADQYFIGNTIDMGGGGDSGINPTGGSTTVVMGNTIKRVAAGWYGIDFSVDVGVWVANDIRVIGNYVQGNMQAALRFQNTSGDTTVLNHVNRIIVANNWVQGDTNLNSAGVYVGGGDATQTPSMLIVGNWFNNLGFGFVSVATLTAVAGKYIIIKDNVFAGSPASNESACSSLIIEGNTTLTSGWNRYGGSIMSCNVDGQNVLTGAIYSNTATGIGYLTTDSVEIIRGATCAPSLIIWGVVTAAGTVTTYVYNPTGGTLNTGAVTKFVVHRAALI